MASLYALTEDLVALDKMLAEIGGDVTEGTDGQTLEKWAEEFQWKMRDKVDGYRGLYRDTETQSDALKAEIKRLQDRKRVIDNRLSRLEALVKYSMERLGVRKLQGLIGDISIRKAGGQRKLALLVKPDELPERFQHVSISEDGDAIRVALDKQDPEILGKAELEPQGEYVKFS